MNLQEINEKIEQTKNMAIDAFNERHPYEARMYVQELQRLDKLKHGYINTVLRGQDSHQ
jgi:hypothetical protein